MGGKQPKKTNFLCASVCLAYTSKQTAAAQGGSCSNAAHKKKCHDGAGGPVAPAARGKCSWPIRKAFPVTVGLGPVLGKFVRVVCSSRTTAETSRNMKCKGRWCTSAQKSAGRSCGGTIEFLRGAASPPKKRKAGTWARASSCSLRRARGHALCVRTWQVRLRVRSNVRLLRAHSCAVLVRAAAWSPAPGA